MAGKRLSIISLYTATEASRSSLKRLTSKLPLLSTSTSTTRRYSSSQQKKDGINEQERARSTADEFKRVAEEKAREEEKSSSQKADQKAREGAEDSTVGTSKTQHDKG